jgi:hypothetical protein
VGSGKNFSRPFIRRAYTIAWDLAFGGLESSKGGGLRAAGVSLKNPFKCLKKLKKTKIFLVFLLIFSNFDSSIQSLVESSVVQRGANVQKWGVVIKEIEVSLKRGGVA